MDRLFQGGFGVERSPWQVGVYPLVNLSEDRDHVYVRAELPGVKAEDLEITIQDNSLILRLNSGIGLFPAGAGPAFPSSAG